MRRNLEKGMKREWTSERFAFRVMAILSWGISFTLTGILFSNIYSDGLFWRSVGWALALLFNCFEVQAWRYGLKNCSTIRGVFAIFFALLIAFISVSASIGAMERRFEKISSDHKIAALLEKNLTAQQELVTQYSETSKALLEINYKSKSADVLHNGSGAMEEMNKSLSTLIDLKENNVTVDYALYTALSQSLNIPVETAAAWVFIIFSITLEILMLFTNFVDNDYLLKASYKKTLVSRTQNQASETDNKEKIEIKPIIMKEVEKVRKSGVTGTKQADIWRAVNHELAKLNPSAKPVTRQHVSQVINEMGGLYVY